MSWGPRLWSWLLGWVSGLRCPSAVWLAGGGLIAMGDGEEEDSNNLNSNTRDQLQIWWVRQLVGGFEMLVDWFIVWYLPFQFPSQMLL